MSVFDEPAEEPDQIRDQLRQLFRYRALLVLGLVLGMLGGAAVSVLGGSTYTATGEVVVHAISTAPFEAGGVSADKQISMGTERQIAQSASVATAAAKSLGIRTDPAGLQRDLRVSNPPETQTLMFEYSADSADRASALVNAFVHAYLDYRQDAATQRIDKTVSKLGTELKPLQEQRKVLDRRIAGASGGAGRATDESERSNLVSEIADLQGRISSLKSLDTTPGDIVRKGDPPAFPSSPGLVMLLLTGAVIGLVLGILAAWVRSVLEPRVRSVADVQDNLRAPVLGILPRRQDSTELLEVGRSGRGNRAEAYRTIAFRLVHDQRFAGRGSLLIVAPRENADAVSVAVNLAGAFAEIGNDILLVEADLRTPRLAQRLPLHPGHGRPVPGSWADGERLAVDAGVDGRFDLLPGREVPNPGRALSSPQFARLLNEPSGPNENVVVVTGPLLSHADGLAVAKQAAGVVVVCDLTEVRRDDLDRVWELITGAGGHILGAVLDKGSRGPSLRRLSDGGPTRRKRGRSRPHAAVVAPPQLPGPVPPGSGPAAPAGTSLDVDTTSLRR
ncbi:polysaccharide biosynthesis tyrosine autokinase [Streptomyces decoyicus]|uniref:polysaccharide biosynthesis tyrosine autokinase n=1 Tax=Streptomyces decoyicus TaxID=249567 RepID=UPI00069E777C|nr:polysaccharide biosynthesis tyrosine autokinase [Streptomyces decoyicus]KOG49517.1 lipopolysaccharide biosynthesis protein [Streptomyces decoyicus]QZY19788.1 lipopolysaccharide biosynthesis protein [Streptomyces decoyicus]